MTSAGPKWNQCSVAVNRRITLGWSMSTPLGRPVDPEV